MSPVATAGPRSGVLSVTVDRGAGIVRASGALTPAGADLLRGTVEGLWRQGHGAVVLDLLAVRSDAAARAVLDEVCGGADQGEGTLVVVPSGWVTHRPAPHQPHPARRAAAAPPPGAARGQR